MSSASSGSEMAYSMGGRIDSSAVTASPSVDSLAASMANQAQVSSGVSNEDDETGFEDTSEDLGVVYFRLINDFRVHINLYNKEHEKKFRLRVSPATSRRSSPTPTVGGSSRLTGAPLFSSTPPQSPLLAQQQHHQQQHRGGASSLSMSMTDMRTHLFTGAMASAASGHPPSRSASVDNLEAAPGTMRHTASSKTTSASTVWDVAQRRNIEQTPKLALSEVVGLVEVKKRLEEMVIQYTNERVRRIFSSGGTPPERTLFVRSEKGSGVHTLVNAVCKKAGVNLLRVSYALEPKWKDDFFVQLLDFALAVQPAMIFFDRCDHWFMNKGEWWLHRGDRLLQALQGNDQIESRRADILFVMSCNTDLVAMNEYFIRWVRPYRKVVHIKMGEDESRECLYQALSAHINDIERAAMEIHDNHVQEYGGIVDASAGTLARERANIQAECQKKRLEMKQLAVKHAEYFADSCTPAMICEFVNKTIDSARLREIRREMNGTAAAPSSSIDGHGDADLGSDQALNMLRLVPQASDLVKVIRSIDNFGPGTIQWKSAPDSG